MAFADDITNLGNQIKQAAIDRAYNNGEAYFTDPNGILPPQLMPPYDAAGSVEAYYADLPNQFTEWTQLPDPAEWDQIISDQAAALQLLLIDPKVGNPVEPNQPLGTARPEFADLVAGNAIDGWSGVAADAFVHDFLAYLRPCTENQALMIAVLKSAAEAQRTIWQNARNDIKTVLNQALNALKNYGGCDQNSWVMTFTVLSAIASIAAVPLSGGSSLVLGITAIGAVSSIASNAVPIVAAPDNTSYSGNRAADIVTAMEQAMTDHNNKIYTALGQVSISVQSALSQFQSDPKTFEPPRPSLADSGNGLTPGH